MFQCETRLSCDVCGKTYRSFGRRMADCVCKKRFRIYQKREGWITVYAKYDICEGCLQHYGIKEVRRMIREKNEKNE